MTLIPNRIPKSFDAIYSQYRNFFDVKENTESNACAFVSNMMRSALAAGICFAVYKKSLLVAAALTTVSVPATMLAAGGILVAYGTTALKAGIVAKQIVQIALGVTAFYLGWQAFDNVAGFGRVGLFDRDKGYTIDALAERIVTKLNSIIKKLRDTK